jgi:phosphatidyl-myo-inositol dimannoside synthase
MNPVAPRLLFVSRNLPPLTGGMERLNFQVYEALRAASSIRVCGPAGVEAFLAAGDLGKAVAMRPLLRFLLQCQWHAWRLARAFKPQWVYSGSGVTAPAAWFAARATGARVVSFLHGLDIVADHAVYRALFLPAIRCCDLLLVNSAHTARLARQAGVDAQKIRVLHPGVALPEWSAREPRRVAFRMQHGYGDRPLILIAGRLTVRKGVVEFIDNVMPGLLAEFPDALLLVVGEEPALALQHRAGVTDAIKQAAARLRQPQAVRMLGRVSDEELTEICFAADLMAFPVQDLPGDVEGFGMVAVEAAAHGLPVAAFAVGGVPDAVVDGESGWLLASGDYSSMLTVLGNYLRLPETARNEQRERCRAFASGFAWEHFGRRLLEILGLRHGA